MTESMSKQQAAATSAAKETPEQTVAPLSAEKLQLSSEVVIFRSDGSIFHENDGEFDLEITGQDVTGTHSHPTPHTVTGTLTGVVITLDSDDGVRNHTGLLVGDTRFIGKREPRDDSLNQEEGVWVGTKKP